MKSKIVAAVTIGLLMGLVASSSLEQSEAQGQREEPKQEWEYKVVGFLAGIKDRNVDEHQQQIEKLAAEGWEYVGPLLAGSHPNLSVPITSGRQDFSGRSRMFAGSTVLFKRPKR
jgi:hypothetical protein